MLISSDEEQVVDVSTLSDDERELYANEKMKMFKMTIVACMLFGSVAVIALLIFFFTSWGDRIYNDMFAFFITYIIGTILIVFYLSHRIYVFRAMKTDMKIGYDAEMCPDYWNLKHTKEDEFFDGEKSYITDKINKNHFRYRCEMNKDLFSPKSIQQNDNKKSESLRKNYNINNNETLYINAADQDKIGINKDEIFEDFKKHAANMNGYTYDDKGNLTKNNSLSLSDGDKTFGANEIPMSCDSVYPLYLSMMDSENSRQNPSEPSNRFRCAYAKSCGVSWTDAGCT